jgi:phospholipase C
MALTIAALASACGDQSGSSSNAICGSRNGPPQSYAHVVWLWMENHSYDQIIGSANAPYLNSLATSCGLATNFHNTTHVSLPNYIAAVTGLDLEAVMPFIFDCSPGGACLTSANSIFAQVPSWKAYQESMPTNCAPTGFVGYAVRHNPPPYLTSLADCATFDVPYTELQADLDNDTLPAFSFITPDTFNDMHDVTNDPADIVTGDIWLSNELPKIFASKAYKSGNTAVFVTFDEGEPAVVTREIFGEDCAAHPEDESCHVVTVVISPYTRAGTRSDDLFTHYSLLRTTEEMLGISTYLGQAAGATDMRSAFNL